MASDLTNAGAALVISGGDLKTVCTHLAGFTADPTVAGVLTNEVANTNGYVRLPVTWTSSGDADEENSGTLTWEASGGDWGEVTHVGLINSSTHGAGTLYTRKALAEPIDVVDGGSITFAAGALIIQASTS